MKPEAESLVVKPIGFIRNSRRTKFDAPHQPKSDSDERAIVELIPDSQFIPALRDLDGFSHIWLIWWFHRNSTWRSTVLPPRGSSKRRGVFATRSPHRPNPLGITAVPLIKIENLSLTIGSNDLVDGTPIFDIKPYLVAADAFPEAKQGWLDCVEAELALPPQYKVTFTPTAEEKLSWLEREFSIQIRERATELLSRDPSPHRTRRIARKKKDGKLRIGCGAWRLVFTVSDFDVSVENVETGYPLEMLLEEGYESIPDREAQLGLLRRAEKQ